MSTPVEETTELVKESLLYKEFLAEREEILRHKWIESEKAGHDIGFEKALLDWIVKYRSAWRERRHKEMSQEKLQQAAALKEKPAFPLTRSREIAKETDANFPDFPKFPLPALAYRAV